MTTRLSILPNWLGDLVMASPALRTWGRGTRHVAVGAPHLTRLVRDLGLVEDTLDYDRHGVEASWRRLPSLRARLRAIGAGEALVLGPSLRAAVLGALSGATERRGLGGEGRELFLTHVHRVRGGSRSEHLSRSWWHVAGGRGAPPGPRWQAGPRGRAGLDGLAREHSLLAQDYAVFAPGATYGATKRWPEEGFASVAAEVRTHHGWTPVFVGSAAPREVEACERLASRTGGLALAGRTDLETLVALLERARLFVGNDSGPMHVAGAVGSPTVGIFGSTSPTWTAPRGEQVRVVGPTPVGCTPCFRSTCPFDLECLRGITPDTVMAAIADLVADASSGGAV